LFFVGACDLRKNVYASRCTHGCINQVVGAHLRTIAILTMTGSMFMIRVTVIRTSANYDHDLSMSTSMMMVLISNIIVMTIVVIMVMII
jgi:purine nucleoside permease